MGDILHVDMFVGNLRGDMFFFLEGQRLVQIFWPSRKILGNAWLCS
jgi:hypothetical protein